MYVNILLVSYIAVKNGVPFSVLYNQKDCRQQSTVLLAIAVSSQISKVLIYQRVVRQQLFLCRLLISSVVASQKIICIVSQTFKGIHTIRTGTNLLSHVIGKLFKILLGLWSIFQKSIQIWIFQNNHLKNSIPKERRNLYKQNPKNYGIHGINPKQKFPDSSWRLFHNYYRGHRVLIFYSIYPIRFYSNCKLSAVILSITYLFKCKKAPNPDGNGVFCLQYVAEIIVEIISC